MPTYTQHDANLDFISSKGFDTSTLTGLRSALKWLKTTDGDNLMYGEPSGDEFDIMVGECVGHARCWTDAYKQRGAGY